MRATKHIALLAAAASLLLASCANYHVRKGEQAVGLMAYAKAEKHFDKALAHQQGRDLLLLTAEAEAKQNKVVQAAEHFAAAEKIAPLTGSDAFQYGRMMMALGEYEKAEPMLLRALQDDPERQDAADLIGACQGYRSFYSDSSRYTVTPLQFAGMATAYSATPSVGGLIFAAQRQASAGRKDPWTGLSFTDLYQVAVGADGATSIPSPLKGAVNGPYHEGSAALSADGKTLYFTRSNYYGNKLLKDNDNVSNLKMFRATKEENGGWGNIREFGYNSAGYSVGLPALSTDGNTLYFTSDMPGGLGGKDLWYSTDIGTGWGAPVNMGPTINTSGDEMFPTVVGDALYFSSTGHTNMGGLDIFETHKEGEFWSEPKNMGYPVNTTRDDFGLWLDSTGTKGYLSSARSGSDQIYALNVHPLLFAVEGTITNVKTGKAGGEVEIWGEKEVCERWGIKRPDQVIDILGLMGDAVDNIPGLPGIGEKTATKLLEEYDNIENLIANADKLKGRDSCPFVELQPQNPHHRFPTTSNAFCSLSPSSSTKVITWSPGVGFRAIW